MSRKAIAIAVLALGLGAFLGTLSTARCGQTADPAAKAAPAATATPVKAPLTGKAAPAAKTAPAEKPAAQCSDAEVKAEVPALNNFHEVIYPLWHTAWPNKDMALMKELMPKIKEHVAAIRAAELPGILRDKKAKWDEGVAAVAADADKLEKALAANEQQAALDAAESLHGGYEGLVRAVWPRMKELDAYHQVLYRVYHYDWPQKDLATLKTHAGEMVTRCGELQTAAVPKRFAAKEAEFKAQFGSLCAATTELKTAADGGDAAVVGPAVDKVHAAYQACEKMFD